MSVANLLWGTPHIHGELLKLGIDVGQTTVAKYMARRRRPPSQGWKTSLHNHADALTAIDMFAVPTISFGLLYALVILRQSRRELLWLGVTAHPNAEWLARQLTLQLERASKLLDPRSRRGVWRCVHAARCSDGHPGSTDLSAVAVAEWIRREADRFDPTGMSFSCYAVSDIFATFSRRIKAASPVCSSLSSRRGQLLPREYGLDNAVVATRRQREKSWEALSSIQGLRPQTWKIALTSLPDAIAEQQHLRRHVISLMSCVVLAADFIPGQKMTSHDTRRDGRSAARSASGLVCYCTRGFTP
jgi:hypothetical protein